MRSGWGGEKSLPPRVNWIVCSRVVSSVYRRAGQRATTKHVGKHTQRCRGASVRERALTVSTSSSRAARVSPWQRLPTVVRLFGETESEEFRWTGQERQECSMRAAEDGENSNAANDA